MQNAFFKLSVALFSLGILTQTAYAQTCNSAMLPTTPDSRFEIISNGSEVKDTKTGLIWQRCSIGQTWSNNTCQGTAQNVTWQVALQSAVNLGNGYRLPNIRELRSLTERQCYDLAINQNIFPNTRPDSYWSSTPYMLQDYSVWAVNFTDGSENQVGSSRNTDLGFVRAVR